jgi:hypothetical protein
VFNVLSCLAHFESQYGDVVYPKGYLLGELDGKRTVLQTGECESSHAKLDVLHFEVLQTLQFRLDDVFYLLLYTSLSGV